jgi:hypothetical protein
MDEVVIELGGGDEEEGAVSGDASFLHLPQVKTILSFPLALCDLPDLLVLCPLTLRVGRLQWRRTALAHGDLEKTLPF